MDSGRSVGGSLTVDQWRLALLEPLKQALRLLSDAGQLAIEVIESQFNWQQLELFFTERSKRHLEIGLAQVGTLSDLRLFLYLAIGR